MFLTDLADAARKSGLKVIELPGWRTNGRPSSTGAFNPRGVLCHHTGSYDAIADAPDDLSYAKWLAFTGRPSDGLPAPLCHLSLSAEGVVYVTAAGRANHAGTAKASGPIPGGDGNELYIGIEAMNDGTQGWAPDQYTAYVRLCRALVDHYGWTPRHVRAHKETSYTGKWDPGGLDMDQFRTDIARSEEDDMPTAKEIAEAVWGHRIPRPGQPDTTIRADVALGQAWNRAAAAGVRKQIAAVREAVDRNADAAEIKSMLESIDATIVLSINEES